MQTGQEWVDVALVEQFSSSAMQTLNVDGRQVVVFHVDGSYHGIQDCCPHDGGDLSSGTMVEGEIICPRHGARFDIKTGRVLSPPAYEDVEVVSVRVHNGMVQIKRSQPGAKETHSCALP